MLDWLSDEVHAIKNEVDPVIEMTAITKAFNGSKTLLAENTKYAATIGKYNSRFVACRSRIQLPLQVLGRVIGPSSIKNSTRCLSALERKFFEDGIRAVQLLNVAATSPPPSRLGDMLDFTSAVSRLGNKSFTVRIKEHCGEQTRLISDRLNAWTRRDSGTLKAEATPPELRTRMEQFLENS